MQKKKKAVKLPVKKKAKLKPGPPPAELKAGAMAGAMDRLEQIMRAVTELYPHDSSAPGLVLSYLPQEQNSGKRFYASLVRYEDRLGQGKKMLVSVRGDTLAGAIELLAVEWFAATKTARQLAKESRVIIRKLMPKPDADDFLDRWGENN